MSNTAAVPGPSAAGHLEPTVRVVNVTKRFGATLALGGVSFDVEHGETLGLLGANGAGKSTLIKILAGLQPASTGTFFVDGSESDFSTPVQARDAGIVTVHQNIDDGVVFGMSVAENLLLDKLGEGGNPFVTRRSIHREARHMLEQLELELPLTAMVEDLSASQRQQVSIGRALVRKPKLLILDEPTSTLSAREADQLFDAVRDMQRRGISVLYVSHHMSEIEELCDRAVVLRNGRAVSSHDTPLDRKAITHSILGDLELSSAHMPRVGTDLVFSGTDLRVKQHHDGNNLEFRRGEVVGITGLVGAGKTELLEQIYGQRALVSGAMSLDGRPFLPKEPAHAIEKGVVMMPEERAAQAIFPGDSVAQHCSIGRLGKSSRFGFLNFAAQKRFAMNVIDHVKVKASGPDAAIESLSGGNQQKVLVGRWLEEAHTLLILDEPFRGVDIGARGMISAALREYSETAAVVVASSDPEEVIEVADRVLVMVEGQIVRDVPSNTLSADQLASTMSATIEAKES